MITKEWLEKMKQKIQANFGGNQDVNWVFPPKEIGNKMVVRIIDPPNQEGFAEVVYKHYSVPFADSSGRPRSFNCLRNYGMECPVCDVVMFYRDISEVKRMKATPRYYFNVLIRKHDEMQSFNPEQVYVMVAPQTVFTSVLKYLTEAEYFIPDLLDPKKGYDIIVERLPDNKLKVEAARVSTPLVQDENKIEKILESVYDLKSFLPEYNDNMLSQAQEIAKKIKEGINRLEKSVSNPQLMNSQQSVKDNLQQNSKPDLPSCFGKYNPNSTNCLLCPHEISCLKESQK